MISHSPSLSDGEQQCPRPPPTSNLRQAHIWCYMVHMVVQDRAISTARMGKGNWSFRSRLITTARELIHSPALAGHLRDISWSMRPPCHLCSAAPRLMSPPAGLPRGRGEQVLEEKELFSPWFVENRKKEVSVDARAIPGQGLPSGNCRRSERVDQRVDITPHLWRSVHAPPWHVRTVPFRTTATQLT